MTAEEYTALGTLVTAVVAIGTGIVAVLTLFALRSDSRERTRPMMTAELVPDVIDQAKLLFVIRNVGPTPAKSVQVRFRPPIPDDARVARYLSARYAAPIPTLAPGSELLSVYGQMIDDGLGSDTAPMAFSVDFEYDDMRKKHYNDSYDLDVMVFHDNPVPGGAAVGTRSEELMRRYSTALEAIARGRAR